MALLPSPRRSISYFALCGFGIVIFGVGIVSMVLRYHSAWWPSVPGKIIESGTRELRGKDSGGRTRVDLTYQYEVGGRGYYASRIGFSEASFPSTREALAYAAQHPIGSGVTVYYLPLWPAMAVLERGGHGTDFVLILCGAWFFVVFRVLGEMNARRKAARMAS